MKEIKKSSVPSAEVFPAFSQIWAECASPLAFVQEPKTLKMVNLERSAGALGLVFVKEPETVYLGRPASRPQPPGPSRPPLAYKKYIKMLLGPPLQKCLYFHDPLKAAGSAIAFVKNLWRIACFIQAGQVHF